MNKVKVGIAQMSCVEDKAQNIERYTEKVRELAAGGAQIICLQELFASLYFCDEERYQNFKLAEPIPEGPTTQHFMALAKELGVVIICSMFEKRAEGLYHNTTAVIDADGSYLGKYRKMHIPDDPGYYEKFYFTPGDLGYKVFKTKFATVGVLICWDQWYPEASRIQPSRVRRFCSIPPPSVGMCGRTSTTTASSTKPGRLSSAAMPSPTASPW